MQLIYGHDAAVAEWVAGQIPHMGEAPSLSAAIGVTDGVDLLAGVVFHEYRPAYRIIEISMAAVNARWARRGVIRALLAYPFEQLGCRQVMTVIPHTNQRAIKFNKGLGFVQRGIVPDYYALKSHAVILTMPAKAYGRLFERA